MDITKKILKILLCVYVIALPSIPESIKLNSGIGNKQLDVAEILLAAIFVVYLIRLITLKACRENFFDGIKDLLKNNLTRSMLALIIIMAFSVIYAGEKGLAISETVRFFTYFLLFFIIRYEITDEKFKQLLLKLYIVICFCIGVFGIVQHFTVIGLDSRFIYSYQFGDSVRITATYDNPNTYAAFVIFSVFPMIMLMLKSNNIKNKLMYFIASGVMFVNLIFTYSRSSWLGFAVGCIFLAIIYNWKWIFAVLGFGGIAAIVPQISMRFGQIFDASVNESRIKIWKTYIKVIKEHLLVGVGNGNSISVYDKYVQTNPDLYMKGFTRFPSHNSYLKVFSELGLIGIAAFILILFFAIIEVKKLIINTNNTFIKNFFMGLLASLSALYFMNLFDNLMTVPKFTVFYWLMIAISQSLLYNNCDKFKH